MKHEWKKHEKEWYGVKDKPEIITIPCQKYIMITGKGNPNDKDFSERVAVLYSLAYPLKMQFKKLCEKDKELASQYEYTDYTVYPLEGVWTTTNSNNLLDKESYEYTIMIRQPEYITKAMFMETVSIVQKKNHILFYKK